MNRDERSLLDRATSALKESAPDDDAIAASAARSAHALGIEITREEFAGAIRNCEGVQLLFAPYRAGTLPANRKLLVDAHLRDCGVCLRRFREGAGVNWSTPQIGVKAPARPLAWGWSLAATAALLITSVFVYRAYWQVPAGVRAEVQTIDGSAYLIGAQGDRRAASGSELREGDELRTASGSHAILRLSDGSVVEMNQRSALDIGARGRDMTVSLKRGAVIVQAAQRTSGHLYVKTPDCRVAVTGTVFSVDAGMKGSRVAVLQGSVNVAHAGIHTVLKPGGQIATSDNLAPEPLDAQFAWSPEHEKYVGILAELAEVEHRIAQIPFPQPRYTSDLLARVPANTLLYVSIPNLGDFLNQANSIFQDQLNQSPDLHAWWTNGQRNPEKLSEMVSKIHDISQYLGNEVVLMGSGQGDRTAVALLADVTKGGLKDELQQQFTDGPNASETRKLVVLDPASLATAPDAGPGGYALVRDHEVVFAANIAMLKTLNSQLDAGASGFADSDFGSQIAAAYGRGAGIIMAANLQAMMMSVAPQMAKGMHAQHAQHAFMSSGLANVHYLIAEHREINGAPANHLALEFSGPRQRIASWLGSPGPIGSLDFVSPNAAIAVGTLTKDPAAIADDLMALATQGNGAKVGWSEIDSKLGINLRDDLMANLGGDFTLALDGPVLPTPSWKLMAEVNNPGALESALERMVQAIGSQVTGPNAPQISIVPSDVDGQRYYTIHDATRNRDAAVYTFADGYMIVAANRVLVMDALRTHANGDTLARSSSFRAQLPRDGNENYSSVLYQNLSPVLTPLLSQFTGDAAAAIQKLAADARPTVICAWGKDNRIDVASDSRLFGFDFLTLGAILQGGNKPGIPHVLP
ncbi:MAG TPA: FecR domain-containing protein [Terracidiphilus sp.]|nr:FecR domain-containing protein [Terracidiphilus sp.]